MRLKLHAKPGELKERGPALLSALAKAVAKESPELAQSLTKAMPLPDVPDQMAYPVLQALREQWGAAYAQQLKLMLRDVGAVLDKAAMSDLTKSKGKSLRERQEDRERKRAKMPEYPVKPGKCPPHQWDRAGERCLRCGYKDWM